MKINISLHLVQIDVSGVTQPVFTCSKITIETLEHRVKYVKVNSKDILVSLLLTLGVVLVSLLLTLNIFHALL